MVRQGVTYRGFFFFFQVISADTLPLKGWETAAAGDLLLRSTCFSASYYRQDKESATMGEFET